MASLISLVPLNNPTKNPTKATMAKMLFTRTKEDGIITWLIPIKTATEIPIIIHPLTSPIIVESFIPLMNPLFETNTSYGLVPVKKAMAANKYGKIIIGPIDVVTKNALTHPKIPITAIMPFNGKDLLKE